MAKCKSRQNATSHVELKINGKSVELNSFVQNFVAETLLGMFKALRDIDKIKTVSLKIRKTA